MLRFSCARPGIGFELRKFAGRSAAREALIAWVSRHHDEFCLIICSTIAEASHLSLELNCPLTASTTADEDDTLVARFRLRKCMVGTSRAGCGLNLIELSRVAIFGEPFSAEHIIQGIGRIRGQGTAALFFFKEFHTPNNEMCNCIAESRCGADLLDKMVLLIDGEDAARTCSMSHEATVVSHVIPDSVSASLPARLSLLKARLNILAGSFNGMTGSCKVCYVLTGKSWLHEVTKCSRLFNLCLHCFLPHQSKSCPKMPKLGRLCFKCFLPLDPVAGISFHDGTTGYTCEHVTCGLLKPLCMLVFAFRINLPTITGWQIDTRADFFGWLLQRTEHVPNVLRLLEAALELHPRLSQ